MSTPTSSRISDSDRYGHWGDDRLYGEDRLDDWSRDEWWRPQKPRSQPDARPAVGQQRE